MLTKDTLKALSRDPQFSRLAAACLTAQTIAEATREKVDGYIGVAFAEFMQHFPMYATLCHDVETDGPARLLTKPGELYLCEDEARCKDFFALCDKAHRMAGFDMPAGYCPASVAEHALCKAEWAFMSYADTQLGTPFMDSHGEHRANALRILHGIALQNPQTGITAKASLPRTPAECAAWVDAAARLDDDSWKITAPVPQS